VSEGGDKDKSEQATPFKLQRAREKGSVARGMDIGFVAALGSALAFLWVTGASWLTIIKSAFTRAIVSAPDLAPSASTIGLVVAEIFRESGWTLVRMSGVIFAAVLLVEFLQVGPVFSLSQLKPDFKRLNPVTGIKRLFTFRQVLETLKNVAKLAVYSLAAWLVIRGLFRESSLEIHDGSSLLGLMAHAGLRLALAFLGVVAAFAVIDQFIARRDFSRRMRMSRREVRREHRDREGDSRMKQKRKQMHAEFVKQSQSIRGIPGADVLITNPEHIALGLRYDAKSMSAPVIVSIGTNAFAQRLKRLAFLYGVMVVEDKTLARELFRHAVLNRPVPDHCFAPVASVYNRLRNAARQAM
jgi:flagellar biosynthesis protein FlhB